MNYVPENLGGVFTAIVSIVSTGVKAGVEGGRAVRERKEAAIDTETSESAMKNDMRLAQIRAYTGAAQAESDIYSSKKAHEEKMDNIKKIGLAAGIGVGLFALLETM